MQSGKNIMESVKEGAANVAASAKSGMEKTKATLQEKKERMTAHDPVEKEMATEKKNERITQAELNKQEARQQNAAARQAASAGGHTGSTGYTATGYTTSGTGTGTGTAGYNTTTTDTGTATYSTAGATGHPTGTHQMSAMPGHGTRQPAGQATDGVMGAHPIGTNTGTGRTTAHNPDTGGTNTGYVYGSGGSYS